MEASRAATVAIDTYNGAALAFQAACERGDFATAEQHRIIAVSSMEAYFDNIALAFREALK